MTSDYRRDLAACVRLAGAKGVLLHVQSGKVSAYAVDPTYGGGIMALGRTPNTALRGLLRELKKRDGRKA